MISNENLHSTTSLVLTKTFRRGTVTKSYSPNGLVSVQTRDFFKKVTYKSEYTPHTPSILSTRVPTSYLTIYGLRPFPLTTSCPYPSFSPINYTCLYVNLSFLFNITDYRLIPLIPTVVT